MPRQRRPENERRQYRPVDPSELHELNVPQLRSQNNAHMRI
jgi:hypothetical protein